MRTIKFRGRKFLYNTWEYGSLIIPYEHPNECIIENEGSWYVDANTVGQFTGLRDVNGKEIYEGDIINDETNCYSVVRYIEEQGQFIQQFKGGHFGPLTVCDIKIFKDKVIGNIHDNPELIK
jgi:uncharacterized phage protein (TIGR01671 family)